MDLEARVDGSEAYKNMEMTREHTSFSFDPRDMLVSLQIGCSFIRASVACAILERTSDTEPSSETAAHRYLKLGTDPFSTLFTRPVIGACQVSVQSEIT